MKSFFFLPSGWSGMMTIIGFGSQFHYYTHIIPLQVVNKYSQNFRQNTEIHGKKNVVLNFEK